MAAIMTDGPLLEPEDKDISEFHSGYRSMLGATVGDAFEDSATQQLLGIGELEAAKGNDLSRMSATDDASAFGGAPSPPPKADARIDMIDALNQVKKAGLEKTLKLPNEPDIAPGALALMINRERARQERQSTIDRGPNGYVAGALSVGTSFLVGAVDPLNIASAFVPVIGELRYGKLLAGASASAAARAGVRAGVGAAQGVTGQALLEPIDWYAHSQDGRDFGMSDVLHNLIFGGLLGAGLHAGGGALSDAWRAHKGRDLYPYGPGEPLDRGAAQAAAAPEREAAIAPDLDAVDRVLAGQSAAPLREVAPELAVLDDLPPRAQEDAARASIASLLDGTPVRSAELLDAAAQTDPRIAESFDLARPPEALTPSAARQAVADDIRQKLLDAGLPPEQADANAALTAARYAARADRLGAGQNALEMYRGAGIDVRRGDLAATEDGRVLNQRGREPDLFAEREAEGQTVLPGTEPIGQGELAQRRADQPLKPGGAQKPLDVGLFGDEAAQKSFFQSQPQAPPFYSAVDRAITSVGQDRASPEQWLGTLKNATGVKAEEMKWLGLEDWLKEQQGSVSKQHLQDYVRANAIEVKEVAKGGIDIEKRARELGEAENPGRWETIGGGGQEHYYRDARRENATKYPTYTLPGGENYRELLLTLPEKKQFDPALVRVERVPLSATQSNVRLFYGDKRIGTFADNPAAPHPDEYWVDLMQRRSAGDRSLGVGPLDEGANFRSSHWDEPNVLAHIRFDDRISDGKKTLHLAEVQSDWHQAGKRKGYTNPQAKIEADRLGEEQKSRRLAVDKMLRTHDLLGFDSLSEARSAIAKENPAQWEFDTPADLALANEYSAAAKEIKRLLDQSREGVPDAPFKTTWPELSMKRMIRYAAEHGYDRVSWDTGATNAERYDLSKQVQKIEAIKFHDGVWRLDGIDQHGQSFAIANQVPAEKLADFVGKDLAEKIVNDKRQTPNSVVGYSGVDLKVGGEGMAGFYDRILPATVNRLVKKFGAKVEESAVAADKEGWHITPPDQTTSGKWMVKSSDYNSKGLQFETEASARAALAERIGSEPVHSLDITPELRRAAMQHGFPLFQGGAEAPRGRITLADNRTIIDLYKSADASTFLHESGHLWLDELMRDAAGADAPAALRADRDTVLGWLGVKDAAEIATPQHEKWAEGFEQYLATGEAPSGALAKAFAQFKTWLDEIYRALSQSGQTISPEIKAVMDRLLASDAEIADRADDLGATTRAVDKAPRGRAAADPQTWSLYEYLASKGGLKPDPELEAIFGGKRGPMIGGFGPLLRRDGMALDEALRVAKEGHYLFDEADITGAEARLTPRDLLDSLDRESRGQRVYRNDHVVSDREIPPEEEARHIVAALHDELEAGGGPKGIEIDPKLEARVVEIVQKEGGTDVLAAYERAIMEDTERYEGLAESRRQTEATRHLPGWDAAEPAAAPRAGAADIGGSGQARLSAAGAGAADGGEPRAAGAGDRAPGAAQLGAPRLAPGLRPQAPPSAEAWHALARAVPEYDAPDAVHASQAASAAPEPLPVNATASERTKAALAADQTSAELYEARAAFLAPEERMRIDYALRQINLEESDRREIFARGAVCLAEAAGVVA